MKTIELSHNDDLIDVIRKMNTNMKLLIAEIEVLRKRIEQLERS